MIGYDNLLVNQELVLDLPFREGTGTITADYSKVYANAPTLTGAPTWSFLGSDLNYLEFVPGNPDRIVILAADSTALNFTSGDFSGAVWISPHAYGNRYMMHKGAAGTGWGFWLDSASPYIVFTTEQAGPAYQSTDGCADLALNAWQLVGFTRDGAAGRVYLNGRDKTVTPATHVNPVSAAAGDFYIGTTVGGGAGWYDGYMWRPRVWKRALSAAEMLAIYEAERGLLGV